MSASPTPAPYETMATPPEDRPAKRQKTLACGRCRRRKQKCDEQRPCNNCAKAGEMCHEVVPRLAMGTMPYSQMALPSPVDITSLEERVAKLEKAQILAQQWQLGGHGQTLLNQHRAANGYDRTAAMPSPEGTFAHTQSPSSHGASASVYSCDGSSNGSVASLRAHSGASLRISSFTAGAGLACQQQQHQQQQQQHQHQQLHHQYQQHYAPRPGSSMSSSAPAIGLLATFAKPDGAGPHGSPQPFAMNLDSSTEKALIEVYRTRIHSRYAFLDLGKLRDPSWAGKPWAGYFTNMVYSIGMLLRGQQNHLAFYRLAVTRHLSHVFAQPDRVLHVQAHLLLAMHALHSPSTERLISIAGATMRYCLLAGLHVEEVEDDDGDKNENENENDDDDDDDNAAEDNDNKDDDDDDENENDDDDDDVDGGQGGRAATGGKGSSSKGSSSSKAQLRRRVFWAAYALDRAAATTFDLPPSIADDHITVGWYTDVEDTALLYAQGLRIQGKALNLRLSRREGFGEEATQLLAELVGWGEKCRERFPDATWLQLTCHVSIAKLFGRGIHGAVDAATAAAAAAAAAPTAAITPQSTGSTGGGNSDQEAGTHDEENSADRRRDSLLESLKAVRHSATQACLMFRHLQRSIGVVNSERSWLAMVAQFKCGVCLLYGSRAPIAGSAKENNDLEEAISACSASLAALAKHWPQSRCLSDVFNLLVGQSHLAGESRHECGAGAATGKRKRSSQEEDPARRINEWLPALESIVMHRPTLKLIRRLATRAASSATSRSLPLSPTDDAGSSSNSSSSSSSSIRSTSRPGEGFVGGDSGKEDLAREISSLSSPSSSSYPLLDLGHDRAEEADVLFRAASPAFFLPDPPLTSEMPERDYRFDYLDLGGTDGMPFETSLLA